MSARPRLYTIPAGLPFLDALAAGLAERSGADALADARVLLPTRRACRALAEAFLRLGGGRPMLLPAMTPLGDVDEDELAFTEHGQDLDFPPAISGTRRQMLLTRLVLALKSGHATPDQAARLAAELARLLDRVATERVSFDRLADLVPDELAGHWQITLKFMKILTEQWPAVLEDEGCIEPADRRNRLLEAQARAWRLAPPPGPVVAAGSTGTVPATADLLDVICRLPDGAVVLPGLDREQGPDAWAALEPTHPQYAMARLLERLGAEPGDVEDWPAPGVPATTPARAAVVNRALRPAAVPAISAAPALDGVVRIDCPGPHEEAGVIALIMRQCLEDQGRTAALVTPDRALARRVAAELGRWGIDIDDSAGTPLSRTPPGSFLRLSARMAAEGLAPVPLLAALKHPLAAGGMAPSAFRALVRRLETAGLRGPRPGPGMGGLRAALEAKDKKALAPLLEALDEASGPFIRALKRKRTPLRDLLGAHVEMAEALAASDTDEGAARLWAGEAGAEAAAFVAEVADSAGVLDPVGGSAYAALLDVLMAGRAVRPRFGKHPRLHIWGLLEARLQHADTIVMGGLNEGTWPPEAAASPWMSRPMLAEFGLPEPERRIGLAAHDFSQAFSAPRVVLTRSAKAGGTPTVPCRWLLRLDNLGPGAVPKRDAEWLHWQGLLDQPTAIRAAPPPAPRPPLEARPRRLSVTQIETWMRDPYGIYARHVLGLKALDPIDADPDAADYGSLIHRALDDFLGAHPGPLPEDALDLLMESGRKTFGRFLDRPGVWAFWWPRFERIARWFIPVQRRRREFVRASASEAVGSLTLDGPAGPFVLTARADRLDVLEDGTIAVIDYKTGAPPSPREVAAGFAPQLPLEAAIAEAGGFEGVPAAPVSALEYWRLRGGSLGGEIRSAGDDVPALISHALEGLGRLIAAFDSGDTPYQARPRPDQAPRFSDYEHLARVKEWSVADGDDGP